MSAQFHTTGYALKGKQIIKLILKKVHDTTDNIK